MARGHPDYSNPLYQVSGVNLDVGALVLILKGVASVDGLGRTILFDTFGEGLYNWTLLGTTGGAPPVAMTNRAMIAPVGVYFEGGTVNGAGSQMYQMLYMGSPAKVGFEIGVWYADDVADVLFWFTYQTGTYAVTAECKITPSSGQMSIRNSAGGYTIVGNLPSAPTAGMWTAVKLVVDFETLTYTRLIFGAEVVALGQDVFAAEEENDAGTMRISIQGVRVDASHKDQYIGYVILSDDNP